MVLATVQNDAACSLLGPVPPPLALRVCGGEYDGVVLRLRSPKCTIGSDPTCTLRLQSEEIGPFHCLILRGAAGTFVRRWSLGTTLNGAGFDLAPLRPGDRLRVGAVEFEMLPEAVSAETEPAEEDAPVGLDSLDSPPSNATPDWLAEREQWQVQMRELAAENERLQQTLAAQEQQSQRLVVEHREQLVSLRDELTVAMASGADQRAAQAELAAKAEAAVAQIVSLHDQVTQLREQLELQRSETSTSRGQLESELRACQEQLSAAREQLQERDSDWRATREQLEAEFADSLAAAQARSQALEEELRAIRAEVESWQQDRQQRLAVSAAAKRPVVTEVMPNESSPSGTLALDPRELTAAAHEVAGPHDVELADDHSPSEPASAPTAADAVPHAAGGDEDGNEIQLYMERLLRRVATTPGQPESPEVEGDTPARQLTPVVEPVPLESSEHVALTDPPKRRESATVEAQEDLVAMRELAQRSTRLAITHSDRRTHVKAMLGEVSVAMVCLVSGILVAALSRSTLSVETISGALGISFGLAFSGRAVQRIRRLRKQYTVQPSHTEL